jgi:hypothetical protein
MSSYSNIVNLGLTHDDGLENAAGLEENALLLLVGDIANEAVPVVGATLESVITISGNHILKAGKAPIPCFTITEKTDLESAMAGEVYSMCFQPNVTIFVPQTAAANVAQYSVLKNARLIVLIKPTNEDYYIQVGTGKLAAKTKSGSVKHGKGLTGEKGITFVLEASGPHPYYIYKGAIPAPAAN